MTKQPNPSEATLPSDFDIRITRTFHAPRQTVFDAWTQPQQVAVWWDPSRQPLAHCEIDLRAGGAFRFDHQKNASGSGHVFSGVYREVTRPSRLVFATPTPSGGTSTGTLLFDEHDGVTTLVMTITCSSKADRDALLQMRVDAGTIRSLENLSDFLAQSA